MSFDVISNSQETKKIWEAVSTERKALQAEGHLPEWYTSQGWQMFKKSYAVEGELAVLGRFKTIAYTLSRHLGKYADEYEHLFFDELWSGRLSPSSPALANTGTTRGLPVACSGQEINDTVYSFYENLKETAILSQQGFGTSGDFSKIRPRGSKFSTNGKANGAAEVMEDFFTCASKISQGGNRRGSFAAYIDIEHDDWDECCDKLLIHGNGRNYGWIVKDSFIEKLKSEDAEAKRRFTKALHTKLVTGKGYVFFVDKANRHRPQMYKDHGLDIVATNLCTEIMLHSSEDISFSCILASMNLVHWDHIKTSNSVFIGTVFLDCLCSEFLEKGKDIAGLEKVLRSAELGRALGLGVMGFHTYLQANMIPYASLDAQFIDMEIYEHMNKESLRASQWLAQEFGEPEWCKGYGVRNTHRIALAPTKSTAILMGGVSESNFPDPGWVYEASSAVGGLSRIPPVFYELLKKKGIYNQETLNEIIANVGSIQRMDVFTPEEKAVFANAYEIPQMVILRRATLRQKNICQGQSLNFWFSEDGSEDEIAEVMSMAFTHEDCLAQYYIYSRSGVVVMDECLACSA